MTALKASEREVDAALPRDIPQSAQDTEQHFRMPAPPQPRGPVSNLGDRKDVRELQNMIEQAFALLDEAADRESGAAPHEPAVAMPQGLRALGAPPGSELRYRSSWAGRIFKTFAGTAIIVAVGLVPLQRVTTLVSNEAYVDAPVYLLKSPADGVFKRAQLTVGSLVAPGVPLALIESPSGSIHDTAVVASTSGKVWDVKFQPGDQVAKGDVIARIVGCSASSVVATVPEGTYDKLSPGMPARFSFYGSNHFHYGTVGNLLGHSATTGGYAITVLQSDARAYRVAVSLPDLGAVEDCAVGRRGTVVFGQQAR